jgi:hypothetical protein
MKDAEPCGVGNGIRAADGVELLQERSNVIFGCVRRNPEPARNQLVRRALCQQRKHLKFPGRECNGGIGFRCCRGRGDNKRVRFIVLADQLQPFHLVKGRRDPIGESGIRHVDR